MRRLLSLCLLIVMLSIILFGATTTTLKYLGTGQETCTFAGIANAQAHSCAMVTNTTNNDLEDLVWIVFKTNASGVSANGVITPYAYGCQNAQTGNCADAGEILGTDANVTLPTGGTVLPLLVGATTTCWANAVSTTTRCGPYSIANTFGTYIPAGWGIVYVNNSGAALDATCAACGVFFDRYGLQNN